MWTAPTEDLTGVKLEEDDKELELQLALKKTQRLKKGHTVGIQKTIETIKQEILSSEENQTGNIVLNSTAEFCRTLGDIPTYGLAGNREENGQELMASNNENIVFVMWYLCYINELSCNINVGFRNGWS